MLVSAVLVASVVFSTVVVQAQSRGGSQDGGQSGDPAKDPGVRGGAPGVGGPLPNLSPQYQAFFEAALTRFQDVDGPANGLGPGFNSNSCSSCHAQPAIGGSSPALNPQVDFASPTNQMPSFITANGPVRETRFISLPNGQPDGGVHNVFVITGQPGTAGCNMQQPNYEAELAANNVIFRIPTPLFGLGLVEDIDDATIKAGINDPRKAALGIHGQANLSGNTGNVTRFGWKAQNASLMIFAGEAYNVEMGVTNEIFPVKRNVLNNPSCQLNPLPEDFPNSTDQSNGVSLMSGILDDVSNFAEFMRTTAPPQPAAPTPQTIAGQGLFVLVGCAACHTPTLNTGSSSYITGLANTPVNAFSDFLVHHMGQGLADGITQGNAGPDQFRTAPLWGIGQRIFFLHDGRTSDLMQAILAHQSQGSEANQVIHNFNRLQPFEQQAILDFLRSL
ncbi:MAG: di-heme oxidoredictase family protein [Candidatus Acidiferrales bacterium]